VSKGARAYRAPSVAGIAWAELIRRTTRDASSHEVLDDIHPVRDSIGEAAARTRFGGSRDIQTDIYIDSDDHIDYDDTYADQTQQWNAQSMVEDALLSSVAGSRATESAAPSANRRQVINTHRRAVIITANKALRNEASCPECRERSTSISFSAHVLAIESDEDTVHGRNHVVPLVFTRSLRSANNLCATRLCSFSRHLREESHVDGHFVCCEIAPNVLNRRGTDTERFSKLCEGETKRGRPLLVPQPITRRCSDASARAAASTRREPNCLSTCWLKRDQRDLSVR
jgi:hypothetical protein